MYNDNCNNLVNTIFPLATEVVCDGIDQNCDGAEVCFDYSDDRWDDNWIDEEIDFEFDCEE